MRYVSAILDGGGKAVDDFEYELMTGFGGHQFIIRDTEMKFDLDGVGAHIGDCIGKGIITESNTGVVCKHTQKTASFHKYVNIADTRAGVCPFVYKEADVINFGGLGHSILPRTGGILDIRMKHYNVFTFGECGSVVVMESVGVPFKVICPLYDLFIYMCRETGINLMAYETIQFGSSRMIWQTNVRLIHNEESERFFTKMMLDVTGSYAGKTERINNLILL